MKNILSTGVIMLAVLANVSAQGIEMSSDVLCILKSDTTTKSVLLSKKYETEKGHLSPAIGVSALSDSNFVLQHRSLLWFDYGQLPNFIQPWQIKSAKLVLYPLHTDFNIVNLRPQYSEVSIRRVTTIWEDSLTNWFNQPQINNDDEGFKLLKSNKKDDFVVFDVTKIVKNMFKYGNRGFMICEKDSLGTSASYFYQQFASPRNINEKLHPVLKINFVQYSHAAVIPNANDDLPLLPTTASDRNQILQTYLRPEPVGTTQSSGPVKNQE